MQKILRPFARILIILLIPIAFLGCSFLFKGKPTANYQYVLRADLGDLLRDMSDNNRDSLFNAAVRQADSVSNAGAGNFMDELTKIYSSKNTEGKLAPVFTSVPQYVHRADPNEKVLEYLNTELQKELGEVFLILKTRIDQYGAYPDMKIDYTKGTITVDVAVYGPDLIRLEKIMQTPGKLEFWNTYENEELIYDLIEADKALAKWKKAKDEPEANPDSLVPVRWQHGYSVPVLELKWDSMVPMPPVKDTVNPLLKILYLRADNQNGAYPGACIGLAFGRDTAKVNRYLSMDIVRSNFPKDVKFLWRAKPLNNKNVFELFAIRTNRALIGAPLDGDVITDASQGFDPNGLPTVLLTMNALGSDKWERMTDEASHSSMTVRGKSKSVKRCVAMVLDGKVLYAPCVQNKISGGKIEMTGVADVPEAMDLTNILKSGAIKCRIRIISENILRNATGK